VEIKLKKFLLERIVYYKLFKKRNGETLDYCFQEFKRNANKAIDIIPFYRNYPKINSVGDFKHLPFIDKEIVNQNQKKILNSNAGCIFNDWVSTGGTSGKPLSLLMPKKRFIQEYSAMYSIWNKTNWDFDRRAVIRNNKISNGYKYKCFDNAFIFDGFNSDVEYFEYIYTILRNKNIQYIHAYPSIAYEISKFFKKQKKDVSFIKAFLSGSENIYDYQVDLIEKDLGIRFFNWYGHSEKLILAGYCEHTRDYHIEPYYGYFELIDIDGKVIDKPGEIGEIVGSSIHNAAMPLLRYRTGDFAEFVGDRCDKCGRKVPIIRNIKGRWNGEKIFNVDKSYVTTTALNLHSDLYRVIEGIQFIQEKYGVLDVLIIPSEGLNERNEMLLKEHFQSKFNLDFKINLLKVNHLKKNKNGKFLQLISSLI